MRGRPHPCVTHWYTPAQYGHIDSYRMQRCSVVQGGWVEGVGGERDYLCFCSALRDKDTRQNSTTAVLVLTAAGVVTILESRSPCLPVHRRRDYFCCRAWQPYTAVTVTLLSTSNRRADVTCSRDASAPASAVSHYHSTATAGSSQQ